MARVYPLRLFVAFMTASRRRTRARTSDSAGASLARPRAPPAAGRARRDGIRVPVRVMAIAGAWAAYGAAAAVPASDRQAWTEVDVTVPLAPALSSTIIALARAGAALPDPTVAGGGITADLDLRAWTLGLGAYEVSVRNAADGARGSIRIPFANATIAADASGLRLANRVRVLELANLTGSPVFCADKLSADMGLPVPVASAHVFASDEFFYDVALDRWYRNRAQIGAGMPAAGHGELQVYYLRQNDHQGEPRVLNVLGLTWKFAL